MEELHNSFARGHFAIKLGAQFGSSFFCFEIYRMDTEASSISIRPLVVVKKAPEKISAHRNSIGNGSLKMHQVIAQIHDAADILQSASIPNAAEATTPTRAEGMS